MGGRADPGRLIQLRYEMGSILFFWIDLLPVGWGGMLRC